MVGPGRHVGSLRHCVVAGWKRTFACYSSSLRSSLICLAWEKHKLAQVLNSNLISE